PLERPRGRPGHRGRVGPALHCTPGSPRIVNSALASRLDALLPQTQCTRCGYDGCRPYAEAMAQGAAQHNRCPPGGDGVIAGLAAALGREPIALDAGVGPATAP